MFKEEIAQQEADERNKLTAKLFRGGALVDKTLCKSVFENPKFLKYYDRKWKFDTSCLSPFVGHKEWKKLKEEAYIDSFDSKRYQQSKRVKEKTALFKKGKREKSCDDLPKEVA
jgi:hypothetical protein